MKKVSVIVPVYNTGNFIKECLISLFNQSYNDYEIIIINDGSNDDSEKIILELIKDKNNCKYVYQTNLGLSEARNTGIRESEGKYLVFVDSDDWVEKDYLKLLVNGIEMNNADICVCGYYRKYQNKVLSKITPKNELIEINEENKLLNYYYKTFIENKYGITCWNKIYKKELFNKFSLKFEKNKEIFAEDLLFNTKLFLHIKRINYLSTPLYNYRIREGSITQSYKKNLEIQYAELLNRLDLYIKNNMKTYNSELISLIYYEAINVIINNMYKQRLSLRKITKKLKVLDIEKLKFISKQNNLLTGVSFKYKVFFIILNFCVKVRSYMFISLLFWIKNFLDLAIKKLILKS